MLDCLVRIIYTSSFLLSTIKSVLRGVFLKEEHFGYFLIGEKPVLALCQAHKLFLNAL